MSDYMIATASTCDLDAAWLESHHVPFISYTYSVDGTEYKDDCTDASKDFLYRSMREKREVTTSAISVFSYYSFFAKLLSQQKDILYVDMSGAISSSISNCERALEQIRQDYPGRRVYFMNSLCITAGLNLFVRRLVSMHEAGSSMDEVIAWGEEHKTEYIHRFLVEDLEWLRRGGRLSNLSATLGTVLSIKPEIYVDLEGKLVCFAQARGRRRAIRLMLEGVTRDLAPYSGEEGIIIETADDPEDGEKVIPMLKEMYPPAGKCAL
jgi:DegV family protein with EDD domain